MALGFYHAENFDILKGLSIFRHLAQKRNYLLFSQIFIFNKEINRNKSGLCNYLFIKGHNPSRIVWWGDDSVAMKFGVLDIYYFAILSEPPYFYSMLLGEHKRSLLLKWSYVYGDSLCCQKLFCFISYIFKLLGVIVLGWPLKYIIKYRSYK